MKQSMGIKGENNTLDQSSLTDGGNNFEDASGLRVLSIGSHDEVL